MQNGAYVINLNEYRDIGTHWVTLYVNNKTIIYFDSFGVERIPKEIIKFIGNTSFGLRSKELGSAVGFHRRKITNTFRIQAYDSIICGYFCIGFIIFTFNGNSLTDYTSLFSPNDLKKKRRYNS